MTASQKLRIGVDLDDVCIDFVGTLVDTYNDRFIYDEGDRVLYHEVTQWGLIVPDGGPLDFTTYDELWQWVTDEVLDRWAAAPAVLGARGYLEQLSAQGHQLVCITSKATEHRNVAYQSIAQNGFPFDEVHVTNDKVAVPRCDVYIDDSPKHLELLTEAYAPESLVIRYARGWNRPGQGTATAPAWAQVFDLIQQFQADLQNRVIVDPVEEFAPPPRFSVMQNPDEEVRVTDPKTGGQKGQKLAQLGALDPVSLLEVARVAGMGAQKYERYNFLRGYDWSLSFDALQRHLLQFWSGEDYDGESGRLHVAHAGWHCMTLASFILRGLGTDDRYRQP